MSLPAPYADPKVHGMTDPVTMRRRLRLELKRLRTPHDVMQRHVADALGWSQSKVIRIENGALPPNCADIDNLLTVYGEIPQQAALNDSPIPVSYLSTTLHTSGRKATLRIELRPVRHS